MVRDESRPKEEGIRAWGAAPSQPTEKQGRDLTLYPHRDVGMPTALAVGNVRRSVSEYAV